MIPSKPDPEKVRFQFVQGGVIAPATRIGSLQLCKMLPAPVLTKRLDGSDGAPFRVLHDCFFGTAAELIADYKSKVEAAVRLACRADESPEDPAVAKRWQDIADFQAMTAGRPSATSPFDYGSLWRNNIDDETIVRLLLSLPDAWGDWIMTVKDEHLRAAGPLGLPSAIGVPIAKRLVAALQDWIARQPSAVESILACPTGPEEPLQPTEASVDGDELELLSDEPSS